MVCHIGQHRVFCLRWHMYAWLFLNCAYGRGMQVPCGHMWYAVAKQERNNNQSKTNVAYGTVQICTSLRQTLRTPYKHQLKSLSSLIFCRSLTKNKVPLSKQQWTIKKVPPLNEYNYPLASAEGVRHVHLSAAASTPAFHMRRFPRYRCLGGRKVGLRIQHYPPTDGFSQGSWSNRTRLPPNTPRVNDEKGLQPVEQLGRSIS